MRIGPWGTRPKQEKAARSGIAQDVDIEERFDCESCGANLTFEPGTSHTTCAHCGHMNSISEEQDVFEEQDYREALVTLERLAGQSSQRVVGCQSCGAQFTLEPDSHAGACPYCGSDVVTDTGRDRPIKPAAIGPFELDQEAARQALRKWLKGLWFSPSGLAKFGRRQGALTGIYLPFWTFDARTESRYRGARGTLTHVPRRMPRLGKRRSSLRTVKTAQVRWRPVSGQVRQKFDDVLALAGSNMPMQRVRALAPWRLGDLVPYREDYLAGFRSEAYQVDLPEGFEEAKEAMHEVIKHRIKAQIGGDLQRITRVETGYADITFKQVLLPVWLAAYRYRGKRYEVVINGQNGRVSGERPYSPVKIAFTAGLVLIALIALFLLLGKG